MKQVIALYDNVSVRPRKFHKYKVLEDIAYTVKNITITVPKMYVTNGADVPRWLWSFQPPNDSEILPAVILHDYLCDVAKYHYSLSLDKNVLTEGYKYAATAFDIILGTLLVESWKRKSLYKAVNGYAKFVKYIYKPGKVSIKNKIKYRESLNVELHTLYKNFYV